MNCTQETSICNMKKTGQKGCVYDFSVDYNTNAVSDILDVHKYGKE